jgi:deoxyribodipyrimidine photolyase-related protein
MYLNAGFLGWREVCDAAAEAYRAGAAPLNAVEGFIRQIIGWREYMRGIYFREGPDYVRRNALGHDRPLPGSTGPPTRRCAASPRPWSRPATKPMPTTSSG